MTLYAGSVNGVSASFICDIAGAAFRFVWEGSTWRVSIVARCSCEHVCVQHLQHRWGSKTLHWQEFTASGTFTPSSALIAAGGACWVRVVGGGGGGGGGNAGVNYSGGGGGGGEDITRPATITSAQTVTIGAGGSASASSTANGGSGGATSIGSISAAGGVGGTYGVSSSAGGLSSGANPGKVAWRPQRCRPWPPAPATLPTVPAAPGNGRRWQRHGGSGQQRWRWRWRRLHRQRRRGRLWPSDRVVVRPPAPLTSLAALALLTGCSSDNSAGQQHHAHGQHAGHAAARTVTPLPTPAAARHHDRAAPRGNVVLRRAGRRDAHGLPRIQAAETAGMVTRLWVTPWSWGGDEAAQIAGINAAGLPTTLDVSRAPVNGSRATTPAACATTPASGWRRTAPGWRLPVRLAHVDAISPIDSPISTTDKSASIVAAVAIIRDVFPRPACALHLRRLPRAVQPGNLRRHRRRQLPGRRQRAAAGRRDQQFRAASCCRIRASSSCPVAPIRATASQRRPSG